MGNIGSHVNPYLGVHQDIKRFSPGGSSREHLAPAARGADHGRHATSGGQNLENRKPGNEIWSFDQSRSRVWSCAFEIRIIPGPRHTRCSLAGQASRNAQGLVFAQLPQSGYPNSYLPLVFTFLRSGNGLTVTPGQLRKPVVYWMISCTDHDCGLWLPPCSNHGEVK